MRTLTNPVHPYDRRQAVAEEVHLGVVGTGEQGATRLIPALQQVPGARIVGLADPQGHRLETIGDQLRVDARAPTARALLDVVRVDALVAACPPSVHEEVLALAIERGIPAMVEKPPASTTQSLATLARASRDRGVITGVGMNFRWAEPIQQITHLLARSDIGAPLSVVIQHQANKPRQPLWNLPVLRSFLLAQSIHPIDLMVSLSGGLREPSVRCHVTEWGLQVDLQAATPGGGLCSLVTGFHRARLRSRIEVTTTNGVRIELSDLSDLTVAGLDEPGWTRIWRPSPLDSGYVRAGFRTELAAFVQAVARREPFTPSLADLLPAYQLIDLICETGPAT